MAIKASVINGTNVDINGTHYDVPAKAKERMSAEIENNKEEEKEPPKRSLRKRVLDHWQIGLKILEIIICGACVGFIYEPAKTTGLGKSHLHHVGIMYTAYTGYMVIISVICIGRALGDRMPFKTMTIFSITGAALFLITGTLLIADRSYLMRHYFYHPQMYLLEMLTGSIVFAFFNVLIFTVDAVITFRKQEDF